MRFRWPHIFSTFLLTGLLSPQECLSVIPRSCAAHIAFFEKHHQIPTGLLHAMSQVESGRKDALEGRIVAWPWTINVEGKGYYFRTKEEAIQTVQLMQTRGIVSIDVGCLQVNLAHHPHAFRTLEDAFDPEQNVAYAALFLKNLKNEHKTWAKAVAHYHSAHPLHHKPYQKKVFLAWAQNPGRNAERSDLYGDQGYSSPQKQARVLLAVHQSSDTPSSEVRRITRNMLRNLR